MGTALVLGGAGYLGKSVIQHLEAQGYFVKALCHEKDLPHPTHCIKGDARTVNFSSLLESESVDVVINLIGIIREAPGQGITYDKLHADVARRLTQSMRLLGPSRLIHMSALGAGPQAKSLYHQSKWIAEKVVEESHLDVTILRPSLLFGGGAEFFRTLAAQVKLPVTPVISAPHALFQPVSRDDVAHFITRIVADKETFHQTFELGGPQRYTLNELYVHVNSALGRGPIRMVHIPWAVAFEIAKLGQPLSKFPVTPDQLIMLTQQNITDDNRWHKWIGKLQPMGTDL